ncbi:MAG: hypothetical protein ABI881_10445 [Betaproteobacteria bacterium]
MEPLLILVVFPAFVGIAAGMLFDDARHASLAAVIGSIVVTCLSVQIVAPGAPWNWLAALLVSLLPLSIAVAAALYWYGRRNTLPRHRRQDA